MNSFSEEIVDEIPKDKTESTAYVSPIDVENFTYYYWRKHKFSSLNNI